MKRVVAFGYFFIVSQFAFAQLRTDVRSRTLISFGETTVNIINNFITDSIRKVSPSFIHSPFREETFLVTGSQLNISLLNIDTGEYFKGSIGYILTDSTEEDKKLFLQSNIQIKINRNNQTMSAWKDINTFPISVIDKSVVETKNRKLYYSIVDDTLHVNETLIVEIRSKTKPDVVFPMRFTRVALPLTPFLAMFMQDSSSTTSETEFIKNAIETGNKEFKSINSFYHDWPALYGKGDGINQQYFSSTKLAFYFRKPNESFPDSSLQYTVVDNVQTDTAWQSSGHLIIITKLQKNHRYTLLVRYKQTPKNVWQTHFYVAPEWYQTSAFYFVSIALAGLLIGSTIIFIFQKQKLRKEKRKTEMLQIEQKVIRAQLNPHFTFNALSSIQSLMNQNKIEEANYYFTEFGSLLRTSLHNNEKEMLPLQIELQTLEQYITLEQLRFGFAYKIDVAKNINTSTIEVPSLLLQPLVENAIKHGISNLQNDGQISVEVISEQTDLLIKINDNGKGFSPQDEQKGYGLLLTKERIRLFNQSHKVEKLQMDINSNKGGTTITLHFLNWL